jgi:DNA modification methylase
MIEIKEEFKKLIPALTAEEFKQLEENILKDGIRDPLVLWNGYLIDGHNRYQIAFKHGLEYKTIDKEFEDQSEVKEWMINNQFGRRNLSNYQRSVLALELESVFSKRAKEQQGQRNDIKPTLAESKPIETRKELAKVANVSHGTLDKVKKIQAVATPEVKAQLSTGEISINQVYQDIKKEEKKINFEQKKSEFEKEIKLINTNQIIILGDSIEVLPTLENNSFDLLLSDPPYGMDFKSGWNNKEKIANDKIEDTIDLFENVLKEVVPLLKEDAHFYLFGNIDFLPEIKPIIKKYLTLKSILIWDRKIIGMGDLKSYGFSYDIIYFGYNKIWKDLNGTRDKDILSFNRVTPSANIHPTEKPIDLLEYLIKKSTNENDKILDPFAGGGSTLIACKNTNRLATGIEIDENYFNLINKKI